MLLLDPEKNLSNSFKETEEIGNLLDLLYIQLLHLLEEQALTQFHQDVNQSRALMILAKVRLQEGYQRTAGTALLPRSRPYKSLVRLIQKIMPWGIAWKLERKQIVPIEGYVQPLKNIFGSLVPIALQVATRKWIACVDQLLNVININVEIKATLNSIHKLKWIVSKRKRRQQNIENSDQ